MAGGDRPRRAGAEVDYAEHYGSAQDASERSLSGDDPIEVSSDDEAALRAAGARRAAAQRLALAADGADDDDEDASEMEVDSGAEDGGKGGAAASGSGGESDEEDDDEEDEEDARPRRAAVAAAAARAAARRRAAASPARRSARGAARAVQTYNEDALFGRVDADDDEDSSDAEDAEGGGDSDGSDGSGSDGDENAAPAARRGPRRAAAAAARRALRPKRRRGGAPRGRAAKRAAVVDDSDDSDGGSASDGGDGDDASVSGSGSDGGGSDSDASGDGAGSDGGGLAEDAGLEVERILDARGDELFVKFAGASYRRAAWVPRAAVEADRAPLLRAFERRAAEGGVDPYGDLVHGVHPDWLEIDRVVAERTRRGRPQLLVKWRGLGYADGTSWEFEHRLVQSDADAAAVARFRARRDAAAARAAAPPRPPLDGLPAPDFGAVPIFSNGRALRPYQLESLAWLASNRYREVNCILGDEMGLGKTAQAIAALEFQRQFDPRGRGAAGPFLVVAPLTTLGHWQREIEAWTDMDVVVFAGGAADRAACAAHDLWGPPPPAGAGGRRRGRALRPDVVLTSFEALRAAGGALDGVAFDALVVDEAHRLKATGSATRAAVEAVSAEWLLLLTGTPVQNNMRELFGLLNVLDADAFPDEAAFLAAYGDERAGVSPAQLAALQAAMAPRLLRRMKEDVEALPEKEEVVIWVELTPPQRLYYRALFERQIGTLLAGAAPKNTPQLRNLAMELRKVCGHPFVCDGLEDDAAARLAAAGGAPQSELDALVGASGKLTLLHKLLPKLRAEGHRVLIFSQFKMMLDVLEDYLRLAGHAYERIDGSTAGRDRQAAIDRFSKEGSDSFVFLLSTRAGGQGITLTAADTCVIYDSDFNPQNDLQAMARCHRIGQDRDVTVYRLVCRDTYEQHVFEISSRKHGLDEAVLGGGAAGDGRDPEADAARIADLLARGAHCLAGPGAEAVAARGAEFAAEGIDEILQGRTEKRQLGTRAGNTFSTATFAAAPAAPGAAGGEFWASLLPEAAAAHAEAARAPAALAPRKRARVNYAEKAGGRRSRRDSGSPGGDSDFRADGDGGGSDSDGGGGGGSGPGAGGAGARKQRADAGAPRASWRAPDVLAYAERLLQLGPRRTAEARATAGGGGVAARKSEAECAALEAALLAAYALAPPPEPFAEPEPRAEAVLPQPGLSRAEMDALVAEAAARAAAARAAWAARRKAHAAAAERGAGAALAGALAAAPGLDPDAVAALRQPRVAAELARAAPRARAALAERRAITLLVAGVDVADPGAPDPPRGDGAEPPRRAFAPPVEWELRGVPEAHADAAAEPRPKGLPQWWSRHRDSALLTGLYCLGSQVPGTRARQFGAHGAEALLTDARFGLARKLAKAPAGGGGAAADGAGDAAAAGGGAPAAGGSPTLLGDKEWKSLVLDIAARCRALAAAAAAVAAVDAARLTESAARAEAARASLAASLAAAQAERAEREAAERAAAEERKRARAEALAKAAARAEALAKAAARAEVEAEARAARLAAAATPGAGAGAATPGSAGAPGLDVFREQRGDFSGGSSAGGSGGGAGGAVSMHRAALVNAAAAAAERRALAGAPNAGDASAALAAVLAPGAAAGHRLKAGKMKQSTLLEAMKRRAGPEAAAPAAEQPAAQAEPEVVVVD